MHSKDWIKVTTILVCACIWLDLQWCGPYRLPQFLIQIIHPREFHLCPVMEAPYVGSQAIAVSRMC